MIFNPNNYEDLVTKKIHELAILTSEGFLKINNLKSLPNLSENASLLHYYKIKNYPFDISQFTEAEIKEEENYTLEETSRLQQMVEGKLKPYELSEEDLTKITISLEEARQTTVSLEEHSEWLESILKQRS